MGPMRGGARFRDYVDSGRNICSVMHGAGVEKMKEVLQRAEEQSRELKISPEDLAKAKSDMSRALPKEAEDGQTEEEESGPEEASDDDEEESRKRSRSPGRPAPASSPKRALVGVFF